MRSTAIVSPNLAANASGIREMLRSRGWQCLQSGCSDTPLDVIPYDTVAFLGTVQDIKEMTELRCAENGDAVAIALVTSDDRSSSSIMRNLIDDKFTAPFTDMSLDAFVRRWHPRPLTATTGRIATELGSAAVADLLDQFRRTLSAALDGPDQLADRALAHRIGGIAGTLGFAALGDLWRGVSIGMSPPVETLRRETRAAIITIRRAGVGNATSESASSAMRK